MSLSDALKAPPKTRQGATCWRHIVEQKLAQADSAALDTALADLAWTSQAIAAALQAEGFDIAGHQVAYHRRRACKCP